MLGKLSAAFQYIMEEWMPANGYQMQDRPCMEVYVSMSPNIVMEAYVPIEPR